MNDAARRENARTLALLTGDSEEEATALLDRAVALTVADEVPAQAVAEHTARILGRTVTTVVPVEAVTGGRFDAEIVIGNRSPQLGLSATVYVTWQSGIIRISREGGGCSGGTGHGISDVIAACYACALTLKAMLGVQLKVPVSSVVEIDLRAWLAEDLALLDRETAIGETVLAGAGAVGNGFAYSLRQFKVRGILHVADDDLVSDGNLQRCICFAQTDIDTPKPACLCRALADSNPELDCVPHNGCRVQDLPIRSNGPWLKRMVVGVDSRRARRKLQDELPGEVFDASTTRAEEIVFHFQKQPSELACLGCIYHENQDEEAHERHVADLLGVTIADVRESRISTPAAAAIYLKNPQLEHATLIGMPYDTLFKQLCATGKLAGTASRQVLTPFAFVSVLAGAVLALEFIRRIHRGHGDLFNDWRISPWCQPNLRRRRVQARVRTCTCCADPAMREVIGSLWGSAHASIRSSG